MRVTDVCIHVPSHVHSDAYCSNFFFSFNQFDLKILKLKRRNADEIIPIYDKKKEYIVNITLLRLLQTALAFEPRRHPET